MSEAILPPEELTRLRKLVSLRLSEAAWNWTEEKQGVTTTGTVAYDAATHPGRFMWLALMPEGEAFVCFIQWIDKCGDQRLWVSIRGSDREELRARAERRALRAAIALWSDEE